jgi:3-oxoacyl-[acyl-carrier-protein] synthase II
MKKRVVITGMGAITPIGNTVETFWENAKAGVSGTGRITSFDPSDHSSQVAAEIKDFDPTTFIDKKEAKRMDCLCAIGDCGGGLWRSPMQNLALDHLDLHRAGSIGWLMAWEGLKTLEEQYRILLEKGAKRVLAIFYSYGNYQFGAGTAFDPLWISGYEYLRGNRLRHRRSCHW